MKTTSPLWPKSISSSCGFRSFLACWTILAILLTGTISTQAQEKSDLKGASAKINLVPNATVDAKEIKLKSDRDHDGMPDEDEAKNGTNPDDSADADTDNDGDGISNGDEVAMGTNPNAADSDGDGISDAEEISLGFDPLDPTSHPTAPAVPGTYQITRSEGATIIPGDTAIDNECDDCSTMITLPFAYTLYDQTATTASISSNGVLEFGSSIDDAGNTCLPYNFLSYAILPHWDDLETEPGVFTSISGDAPNRIFNIEWRAILFSGGGEVNFEVRLYEGQQRFDVIYGNVTGGGDSATIGVQKDTSGNFTQYACSGSTLINAGTQLTFTLAPGTFPTPAPLQIAPNPVEITLNSLLGQQPVQLHVTRANGDGSTDDLTSAPGTLYQSSNPGVAIVDDFGQVAGVTAGSTSISARNGTSLGEVTVNVSSFTPATLSSISIPGYANNVEVVGNYAFVAAGSAGLQVVDISNQSAPLIVGSLATAGNANDLKIVGNTAYVAAGPAGLEIVDLSTPSSPVLLGTALTPGSAQGVVLAGGRAYVADGDSSGLQIIDVSNSSAPTILGSLPLEGFTRAVDISNNLAILGNNFNGLTIVDVTDSGNPQLVGTYGDLGVKIKIRDRFAYIATGNSLIVVDFSVPSNPRLVARRNQTFATAVGLSGRWALTANLNFGGNSATVYDCNDPGDPNYRGVIDSPNPPGTSFFGTGIAVDSQYFYWTGAFRDEFSYWEGGVTANSRLFIGSYQPQTTSQSDTGGIAPVVSVSTPQNGDSVFEGSQMTISATATDDVQVSAVRFSVNGTVVITDFAAPYQFRYTAPLNVTSLVISATAIDSAGNERTSDAVTVSVLPDPPPSVSITSPVEGATLLEGQTIRIEAEASDNVQVSRVAFTINDEDFGNYFDRPYAFSYTVPAGISSATIVATATDNLGRTSSTTRTVAVTAAPRTTVIGQVFDSPGQPAVGLTITVFGEFSTQTDANGVFTLPGVSTVRGDIFANVNGTLSGREINVTTERRPPVADGVTDLGSLTLTRVTSVSLPEAPTASALANLIGDTQDLFLGFPGQPSQVYQADSNLNLLPNTNVTLPFQTVLSGDLLFRSAGAINDRSLVVQQPAQPASATLVQFHFGVVQPPVEVDTGLTSASDFIAAGSDGNLGSVSGSYRSVLAFLKVTGGTSLTVRIGDDQSGFGAPVELPVDAAAALRSPRLIDIGDDGLVDLLLIKQVSGADGRIIVYPRISQTAFGPPVESPITLRNLNASATTADFAVGNLLADSDFTAHVELAVLGDDRIRIYRHSGVGVLTLASEIMLPTDSTPSGIVAVSQVRDSYYDSLIVSLSSTVSPESKSLAVYLPGREEGLTPQMYQYNGSAAIHDTRILVGYLNDRNNSFRADVVIIDGGTATTLWDIGREWFVD